MFRGLYIAGTGMMLQRRKMETITNNITNADTSGYKKDHLVSHTFDDVMLSRINDNDSYILARTPLVGPLTFGTQVDQIYTDFSTGNFEETHRSTDLLVTGDAFFVLETPEGERFSKAGAFLLNSEGFLIDGDGNYLLGSEGRIFVGTDNFYIDELGRLFVDDELTNTLRLVSFADPNNLRKQGGNLFFSLDDPINEPPQGSVVKQGFLENSNIDVGREMVDMMTVYRAYETNQRMVTMIDETIGKAVNEIGRLR